MVALAFITRPDECNVVNHIDGVKINNAVDNLEWCDNKHNVHHAYKMGLNTYRDIVGEKNPTSKLTWKDVREIRELIRQGVPQTELAKRFNVQYACINRIHLNVTWKEST